MKVTVLGSHLCEDTLYALHDLKMKNVEMEFRNLSADLDALKQYLKLREENPIYEPVKAAGGIGIPCFILENGTVTFDIDTVNN